MKAVLFDVGNTLSHLDYAFLAAQICRYRSDATESEVGRADALTRKHGWPGDRDFFEGYFGATAARLGLTPEQAAAFVGIVGAEHRRRASGLWSQVDPDAEDTLRTLARCGLRLGVVSNADGRVEAQLRGFGLRDHFEVVVDSQVAGVAKPDPGIFHVALEAMGVAAADALYIGDIPEVDVSGASAAGMQAVLYDRWDVYPDAPVWRVTRLADLPALVTR